MATSNRENVLVLPFPQAPALSGPAAVVSFLLSSYIPCSSLHYDDTYIGRRPDASCISILMAVGEDGSAPQQPLSQSKRSFSSPRCDSARWGDHAKTTHSRDLYSFRASFFEINPRGPTNAPKKYHALTCDSLPPQIFSPPTPAGLRGRNLSARHRR